MSDTLKDLKQEADALGLKYSANIGEAKLQEKIDEYYESQETSGKEIQEAVEAKEKSEEKSAESGNSKSDRIAERRKAANVEKVVTIIDNDQRVNNQTTTAVVNCSNLFFDLGTVVLPLNIPVKVKQGHINVLKEVKIPQHVKDNRTGLSKARLIPRYTISYEENQG